jgi:hypothetical protein
MSKSQCDRIIERESNQLDFVIFESECNGIIRTKLIDVFYHQIRMRSNY